MINNLIEKESNFYIRIPKDWLWILDELSTQLGIPVVNLKITLMKIKLDDQFKRLGHQFGQCTSNTARIFRRTVPKLAALLKTFLFFPTRKQVKILLPIPFRMNFSKVYAIIDCFEIQIEKPSNALHQALTWSSYKNCNTIKYLLCITPDGLVLFVSPGYEGRISDILLFEICGIMENLPEDCWLMADRGFKGIATILNKKNITLVRPPSVESDVKPSKAEVFLTKRIASVRIHVERSVRRFREFSMLVPHSTLHHPSIAFIEEIIQIASRLINIQHPLIKT